MSFCFLLYLWMPPQKNMQRGNWLGNGYLCIANPTHEFCLFKASLNDSASICECLLVLKVLLMSGEMKTLHEMYFDRDNKCYWFLIRG